MAASRFSSDVLQIFCEPISQEEYQRQKRAIATSRVARERYIDFYLARNDFNGCLRSWKMDVPEGYPYKGGLLQFARKTKQGLLI